MRITNRGNSHGGSNSAGFGFVTFQKESEARKALESKEGIYYNNLQLNVEEKKTRVSHSCRFFFREIVKIMKQTIPRKSDNSTNCQNYKIRTPQSTLSK